jgi:serine/threonine-protein phosphatase 2B regulatory subunit
MGANTSDLTLGDIEEMQVISKCNEQFTLLNVVVSQKEIKKLYRRFQRLDKDATGRISTDELLSIPEFAMNPLAPRIVELFMKQDDRISFRRFVQCLAIFHENAPLQDKIECT